jgi:hypothetical protein
MCIEDKRSGSSSLSDTCAMRSDAKHRKARDLFQAEIDTQGDPCKSSAIAYNIFCETTALYRGDKCQLLDTTRAVSNAHLADI